MNISQAGRIYAILRGFPEEHEFWSEDYPKERCFKNCKVPGMNGDKTLEQWYTHQKQYHWAKHFRRDIIDRELVK